MNGILVSLPGIRVLDSTREKEIEKKREKIFCY